MRRSTPIRVLVLGVVVILLAVALRALRGAPTTAFDPPRRGGPRHRTAPPGDADDHPLADDPPQATSGGVATITDGPGPDPSTSVAPNPPGERWVFPVDGSCPPSHPIKAKLRSGLYHLPGMVAYQRTNPDRCYATEVDAEADGLRRAKR